MVPPLKKSLFFVCLPNDQASYSLPMANHKEVKLTVDSPLHKEGWVKEGQGGGAGWAGYGVKGGVVSA